MALNTGNPFLDALGGTPWLAGHGAVTYFFDNNTSTGHSTGGAWIQGEQERFAAATATWRNVADIRFLGVDKVGAADMVERKVTEVELPGDARADHNTPCDAAHVGRYKATLEDWNAAGMQDGGRMFQTFIRELGHAIGLAHPHDDGQNTGLFPGIDLIDGPEDPDTDPDPGNGDPSDTGDNGLNMRLYTVMSYNNVSDASTDFGHVATPMAFDIATVQLLYGAVDAGLGSDIYTLTDPTAAGAAYRCIWDTGGIDTIAYGGMRNATIDLRSATLANAAGGGGFLSSVAGIQGGFTIAADVTGFAADVGGETGVVIENASGGLAGDRIVGNAARNVLTGNDGDDTIFGFDGKDVLRGGRDADSLVGGVGDDQLFGDFDNDFRGRDTLDGGFGVDTMYGGQGNDTYIVSNSSDVCNETEARPGGGLQDAGGLDEVRSFADYSLLTSDVISMLEDLTFIGASSFVGRGNSLDNQIVGGAMADTLIGESGHDTLIGGGGADVLRGMSGDDSMVGGTGNDVFYVDSVDDKAVEGLLGGTSDCVIGTVTYTLSRSVELLSLIGAEAIDGFGNASANRIVGNAAANLIEGAGGLDSLSGAGGADTLRGGTRADTLNGGSGVDSMEGAAGDDLYDVDATGDVVVELAGGGTDLVRARATWIMSADVENLLLQGVASIDGVGNATANAITGNTARTGWRAEAVPTSWTAASARTC